MFLNEKRGTRFNEIVKRGGMPRSTLAKHLKDLAEEGIIKIQPTKDCKAHIYVVTAKGIREMKPFKARGRKMKSLKDAF